MKARRGQLIIARNLVAGFTGSKSSINFSALDVLACATFSHDATLLLLWRDQTEGSRLQLELDPKSPVMPRPLIVDFGM
jgi:hypothetical protein